MPASLADESKVCNFFRLGSSCQLFKIVSDELFDGRPHDVSPADPATHRWNTNHTVAEHLKKYKVVYRDLVRRADAEKPGWIKRKEWKVVKALLNSDQFWYDVDTVEAVTRPFKEGSLKLQATGINLADTWVILRGVRNAIATMHTEVPVNGKVKITRGDCQRVAKLFDEVRVGAQPLCAIGSHHPAQREGLQGWKELMSLAVALDPRWTGVYADSPLETYTPEDMPSKVEWLACLDSSLIAVRDHHARFDLSIEERDAALKAMNGIQ